LLYLAEPTTATVPTHPLGSRARVLLTSVFGPYAHDDEYGSRAINPMELYHNQVTREQQVFSLRMFHRSWGLMLIQANLSAPTTLLDFPSRERFILELESQRYDVIGISSIIPNIGKVVEMCRLVRKHQPQATIVVGGHVANHPRASQRIDADHVVKGEGVRWFRAFLGEDEDQPIRHPLIASSIGARTMGVPLSAKPRDTAATLIPSVGCPMGCNFCSTSAMFGGKGRFVSFYETGDELFHVMCELEAAMSTRSFFVMDENFLLHRKRALRLLELMQAHHKPWALYVFSSANTLRRYTMEQLVGLGVSWLWMGLEGKNSEYSKLDGADTRALVRELQSHGIRVLGSSIIGLLEHTPDNIDAAIDYAVSHDTEFHQFMLYTPVPGTPLYAEHAAAGTLLAEDECDDADAHGQLRFNYRHPHIEPGMETEYLRRAFRRDFEVNGPSVLRIARTLLLGWRRHKHDPDRRVRERYRWECRDLATAYAGGVWAAERWLAGNPVLAAKLAWLRRELCAEFGLTARLAGPLAGRYVLRAMQVEARRQREGHAYEPPTFYEHNSAFAATQRPSPVSALCQAVEPLPVT
jgi:radical SAM superfamily enzyme YgiQ (UPF0313 family)